jgi:HSP20 family protein
MSALMQAAGYHKEGSMAITRFDPVREIMEMRDTFNRFFEQALAWPRAEFPTIFGDVPALDIYETDEQIKVEVPLPGMKAEEIDVTLQGNLLTVTGEQKSKEEVAEDKYYRHEVRYGTFKRSVVLPETADIEHPETEFEAGVLTVAFPKVAKVEPKKLEVKVAEHAAA